MTAARGFPAVPPRPGRRGRSWWAREFIAAMEDAALDAGLLRRGRRFAGSGRLGPITVSPGRIAAVAEDPDGAYDVVVHLAELTDTDWERFLDQVRAEAGHLAALLDREVPRSLVRSADAAGVPLLPTIGDLESDCDCPEVGDPCQHAAALCYQAAWLLDDDPFVLLLLRGRDADELLDVLARPPDEPAEPATDDGDDPDLDRAVPAAAAYAVPPAALPAEPAGLPQPAAPAFPAAQGLPDHALALLVADAAARARALLADPAPALGAEADAVRWAATHPATAGRVATATGRDLGPAVRAWELGGAAGLAALERADRAPTAEEATAEGAGDLSDARVRRGPDGRWYAFRRAEGRWWPAGPPDRDLEAVLDDA
ncbi:SWIM zinc finger family protein [Pseudonocardia nigra]|uniref:SWIM zinc finger family protein n=1 Tax=Pseudonocardia nigra TaxID=1921578 RepID=UPI0027E34F8A|nr:SWIM zinc finger family protein [Pseudonocardia nigra]